MLRVCLYFFPVPAFLSQCFLPHVILVVFCRFPLYVFLTQLFYLLCLYFVVFYIVFFFFLSNVLPSLGMMFECDPPLLSNILQCISTILMTMSTITFSFSSDDLHFAKTSGQFIFFRLALIFTQSAVS